MPSFVHFLPIATTILSGLFATVLLRHYIAKGQGTHLLWWTGGAIAYGVGTFTEAYTTVFGWHAWSFRLWYIAGALLGGMPLAQGTVYLLLPRRWAHALALTASIVALIASICVIATPLDVTEVETHRLTGSVMSWSWVRGFSPFLNLYALVFLVGGAAISARRYMRVAAMRHRAWGNLLIAVGGLLPGIGGAFTRAGYTEVLYVMELIGLVLIYAGYRRCTEAPWAPVYTADVTFPPHMSYR